MSRWRAWSGAICLVVWLAGGCATRISPSAARHPVPAALTWPVFDRGQTETPVVGVIPPGVILYSVPSEESIIPAEIWTAPAVRQRDALWQRILRDRCAAREALQVANGERAAPDPICKATADERR